MANDSLGPFIIWYRTHPATASVNIWMHGTFPAGMSAELFTVADAL